MATKKKSTALSWIVAEAKDLKKKYPKRFSTWKEYVAQASAIYASKHKGKSPVGKKKIAAPGKAKKTTVKKSPARSMHKDTKSHNVNIRVVSGFDDTDLMDRINKLIKFNKEIEKYILDLNHRIKTDKSDTFVLLQKSRAMAAVKRYKDLLADNKKYLASLKKHIK